MAQQRREGEGRGGERSSQSSEQCEQFQRGDNKQKFGQIKTGREELQLLPSPSPLSCSLYILLSLSYTPSFIVICHCNWANEGASSSSIRKLGKYFQMEFSISAEGEEENEGERGEKGTVRISSKRQQQQQQHERRQHAMRQQQQKQ